MKLSFKVRYQSRLPGLARLLQRNAQIETRKSLARVVTGAKHYAPVDTGFLRSRIAGVQDGTDTGRIEVPVVYAAVAEYGGHNRPAHPYVRPALEDERTIFVRELGKHAFDPQPGVTPESEADDGR